MGVNCIIFEFVECLASSNMALYINNNLALDYHMDADRLTMLGYNYFISPDYLVVNGWIRAMLLSASTMLAGQMLIDTTNSFQSDWVLPI